MTYRIYYRDGRVSPWPHHSWNRVLFHIGRSMQLPYPLQPVLVLPDLTAETLTTAEAEESAAAVGRALAWGDARRAVRRACEAGRR